MANPQAAPGSDEQKREMQEQLKRAMEKKQEMLNAQREGLAKKKSEEAQREKAMSGDIAREVEVAHERGEAREEWRQEKHTQARAEDAARKEALRQAELRKEEERKAEAVRKRKQEYLDSLHANAVKKRVVARHESALKEEEMTKKRVDEQTQRTEMNVGGEEKYKIAHFEEERKRRLAQAAAEKEFTIKRAEENARLDKQRAAKERKEAELRKKREFGSNPSHDEQEKRTIIEHERRKAISNAEELYLVRVERINAEMNQHIEEVKREANAKRIRAQADAQRRTGEATQRRQATEEWLGIEPKEEDA